MRLVIAGGLLLLGICNVQAASSKADCQALRVPLTAMSGQLGQLLSSLKLTANSEAFNRFDGPEKVALDAFDDARAELEASLSAYISAAEDAAYAMTVCAR